MHNIPFYKMSGAGNDFIIIDNRVPVVDENRLNKLIVGACRRKLSVGADGVILIEKSQNADFRWRFYNADGSEAEMCGNGARCAARIASLLGIGKNGRVCFETGAGVIEAEVFASGNAKIRLTEPSPASIDREIVLSGGKNRISFVNTGVPHVVMEVSEIGGIDVKALGREIRRHADFSPAGTNVNFVSAQETGRLAIRTYERGVEDETLACGTGASAAALVMAQKYGWPSPIAVDTRSGSLLTIHFERSDGGFSNLFLEGDARIIYKAELSEEAWA
ncbi:diaminopimelate epimerase [Desulfatirhabdium butyrativorans]|uniref:diaminopimelate epimerase n=1 Tax=Desulfatirhabdium butyrativorans TaxID=340467 RepID=UPI0003FEF17A|nr:diaminopimelate epimerase [Desulfatirhabdium butyrativorans]